MSSSDRRFRIGRILNFTRGIVLTLLAGATAMTASGAILPDGRRITWTAGVPGGVPPRDAVCANVVAQYGARGDGKTDDSAAIQSAINACPVGQVIYIPAGTYKLGRQLTMTKGVVLRGAGAKSTFLKSYAEWHAIQMGDWPGAPRSVDVVGSVAKDAKAIALSSVTSPALNVGDLVVIDQLNDGVEVVNVDDQSRENGARALSQITKVTAISGQNISIAPPLYHAYVASQKPQVWKLNEGVAMTMFAGVEDLSVERVSPTGYEGYSNFKVVACAYCWIKNVESKKAQFRHVDLDRSFKCEVRDSFFNDGMNHGTGGFAYGVVAANRSTDNLIENNIFYHLRHSMVVKEGAAGNVFGYNYSVASYQGENWLAADLNAHGAHSHMNLFEGNIAAKIYADFTHGSSSYNVFLRNHIVRDSSAMTITNARRAVDVEKVQYYYSLIGNVLGSPGQSWTAFEDNGSRSAGSGSYVYTWGYPSDGATSSVDALSKSRTLRHGNFDYQSQGAHWDASIAERVVPNSLYLSSRPSFFGALPWPAIGPDLQVAVGALPAKERYDGIVVPSAPAAPQNLRVMP